MSAGSFSSGCSLAVEPVAVDHEADEAGVALLLIALQIDGIAQERVVDRLGEGLDDGAGASLGVDRPLARTARRAAARVALVELGPRQSPPARRVDASP